MDLSMVGTVIPVWEWVLEKLTETYKEKGIDCCLSLVYDKYIAYDFFFSLLKNLRNIIPIGRVCRCFPFQTLRRPLNWRRLFTPCLMHAFNIRSRPQWEFFFLNGLSRSRGTVCSLHFCDCRSIVGSGYECLLDVSLLHSVQCIGTPTLCPLSANSPASPRTCPNPVCVARRALQFLQHLLLLMGLHSKQSLQGGSRRNGIETNIQLVCLA